jgi:hypothetical protein
MALRGWLAPLAAGVAGAAVVVLAGLLWNLSSNGGLIRILGGVTPAELSGGSAKHAGGAAASSGWQTDADDNGYNPSCDYRFHLLIPPDKSAQISIDLSRYAGDASFIYPTIVNKYFLQAQIAENGESIAIDINDKNSNTCSHGQATLSDLPSMCFDTKIEKRCY